MSEWSYIWGAYGLTWLVFAGYTAFLAGKVRRAEQRLEGIRRYPERG